MDLNRDLELQIRNEIYQKKRIIDLEIHTLQNQLKRLEQRTRHLKLGIFFYAGYLVLPQLLFIILQSICQVIVYSSNSTDLVIGIIGNGLVLAIRMVHFMTYPIFIYQLIKTIALVYLNREDQKLEWTPPSPITLREYQLQRHPNPEKSFPVERMKLVWVLSKYYLYQTNLNRFIEQIDDPEQTPNLREIQLELGQIKFYPNITPTRALDNRTKAKIRTLCIILGILIFILIMITLNRTIH